MSYGSRTKPRPVWLGLFRLKCRFARHRSRNLSISRKGTYALRSGKQRSQPASYRAWRARDVRACHTDCPRSSHGTQHRRPCPNSRPFRSPGRIPRSMRRRTCLLGRRLWHLCRRSRPFRHSLPCQSSKASFPWSPRMMQRGACRHACFCAGQHGRRKPSCHSTDRQAFHLARPTSGPVGPSGSELWIEPRTSQSGQE